MREKSVSIFVGDGHYENLEKLADRRRAQGWHMGATTWSFIKEDFFPSVSDAVVVINGGDAGNCVVSAAGEALRHGARRVVIPLIYIKTHSEGENPLLRRARRLAAGLAEQYLMDDSRLIVTPTVVWEAAKKRT
jgi:NADPH-dependent glutamate synthase beta subunit-like oxidoreductase